MDLEAYQKKAEEKDSVHRTTLKKLKKKPPKRLDTIMQELHEEVFSQIDCLECANCCKTTGPLFTPKDIERISKKLRLKPVQFIEKYLRVDEDQDYVLQSVPCAFLGTDNHCSIYDFRPKACREFPHTERKKFYQINALTLKNCKICPAAFEVVEKLGEKLNP